MTIALPQFRAISAAGVGGGGGTDPNFANVVVLCHFETSSGSSPVSYVNHGSDPNTIQSGGAVIDISATQFKWGAKSLFYPGSGVSNNRCFLNGSFAFGTGDFCQEVWYRPGAVNATYGIFDNRGSGADAAGYIVFINGTVNAGEISMFTNNAVRIASGAGALSANTWHHIALARVSGTSRLFVNGTQVGSDYTDSGNYTATTYVLGSNFNGVQPSLSSYIDDWRITNGVGRYTSNFTPPAAQFPDS